MISKRSNWVCQWRFRKYVLPEYTPWKLPSSMVKQEPIQSHWRERQMTPFNTNAMQGNWFFWKKIHQFHPYATLGRFCQQPRSAENRYHLKRTQFTIYLGKTFMEKPLLIGSPYNKFPLTIIVWKSLERPQKKRVHWLEARRNQFFHIGFPSRKQLFS